MNNPENAKILIIKDIGDLCRSLSGALGIASFDCVITHGEEEGVSAAETCSPHLIIIDTESPRAHGIDILNKLKEKDLVRKTPILIISRYGNRADKLVSYAHGANRFVTRPVDSGVLLGDIRNLLKNRAV